MSALRPKNLNLLTIRQPIPAIVSILHRLSGLFLFFLIPFILCTLNYSLTVDGFTSLQNYLNYPGIRFLVWLFLIPFCFHLVAGIRHLLMDIHLGESLRGGRLSAILAVIFTIILVLILGIWLW